MRYLHQGALHLMRRVLPIALLVVLAPGCVSRMHYLHRAPDNPEGLTVRPAVATTPRPPVATPSVIDEVDIPDGSGAARVEARRMPKRDRGGHEAWELRKKAVGPGEEDGTVRAVYYRGPEAGPRPLVVILPIYGSSQFPPRQLSKQLLADDAHAGTHVLLIESREDFVDWAALRAVDDAESFDREAQRVASSALATVVDLRQLLDWATSRPEVDDARIGLVGFSIGTMVGSLLLGADDRFDTAVFVMGGANIHQVLTHCRGRAGETRRLVIERLGWTSIDYESHLAGALEPVNPAHWVTGVNPRNVLLIDASFDNCVPEEARERLWEAMGRPERITLSYGHRMAFLSMTPLGLRFTTRSILGFLDGRLHREAPTETAEPLVAAAAQ